MAAPARRSAQSLGRLGRGRDRNRLVRRQGPRRRHGISGLRDRTRRGRGGRARRATAPSSRSSQAGEKGFVILNQTPFYAESGGQVGDTGVLHAADVQLRVDNTLKKVGDLFVHEVDGRGRRLRRRRRARARRRSRAPRRHPRQSFRHPSAARGAAPGARRPRRAKRLAGRAPTGCVSISPIPSPSPTRNWRRSRRSPIA